MNRATAYQGHQPPLYQSFGIEYNNKHQSLILKREKKRAHIKCFYISNAWYTYEAIKHAKQSQPHPQIPHYLASK